MAGFHFYGGRRETRIDALSALSGLASVAQRIEHLATNQKVPGSNPGGGEFARRQRLSSTRAARRKTEVWQSGYVSGF